MILCYSYENVHALYCHVLCWLVSWYGQCPMKKCFFCGDNAVGHTTSHNAPNMLAGLMEIVYSYVCLSGFLIVLPYLVLTTLLPCVQILSSLGLFTVFVWGPASFHVEYHYSIVHYVYFEYYCYYCGWACSHMLLGCF